jgi:hypothetical protein
LVETWVNAAGTAVSAGDGGAALSATLNSPNGVLLYNGDTLLVAEMGGDVIRAVDLVTRIITRWAGTGAGGATVDGIHRLAAMLDSPHGLALLPDNSVLIASYAGCRVIRITAAGVTRLFAGTGTCTSTGNGGSALSATLHGPTGIAVDNSTATSASGVATVYWAEFAGHRVRDRGGRGGVGADALSGSVPRPRCEHVPWPSAS